MLLVSGEGLLHARISSIVIKYVQTYKITEVCHHLSGRAVYYIEVHHRNEKTSRHCFELPDTTSIQFALSMPFSTSSPRQECDVESKLSLQRRFDVKHATSSQRQ